MKFRAINLKENGKEVFEILSDELDINSVVLYSDTEIICITDAEGNLIDWKIRQGGVWSGFKMGKMVVDYTFSESEARQFDSFCSNLFI